LKITTQLRIQHDELLALAAELSAQLDLQRLSDDERACREVLRKLLGKLNVHLALEDKILYPKLFGHARKDIVQLARRFTDEMGSLGAEVKEFAERWEAERSIQGRPAAFVEECRGLLAALGRRIQRENAELYDTADGLEF
jgi:hemerythrin-like domain-containing protein